MSEVTIAGIQGVLAGLGGEVVRCLWWAPGEERTFLVDFGIAAVGMVGARALCRDLVTLVKQAEQTSSRLASFTAYAAGYASAYLVVRLLHDHTMAVAAGLSADGLPRSTTGPSATFPESLPLDTIYAAEVGRLAEVLPIEVVHALMDPITRDIFVDPVVLESGISYERDTIAHWIEECESNATQPTDPTTNLPFSPAAARRNHQLRQVVAALHQVYIRDGDADADGNSDDDPEPITEVTEMTMKNKAFGGGQ